MVGKVYIASMNMRGIWAKRPDGVKVINVTSAQARASDFRRDFSPMSPITGKYKGFYCFENYWQAGKVIKNVNQKKHNAWWLKLTKGKRRYPGSRGVEVLYGMYDMFPLNSKKTGTKLDYISARKQVYVPEYYTLMSKTESFKLCSKMVRGGRDVVVCDFDGPRTKDGLPTCLELTLDILKEKINDPTFPFGHGYVVAASLMGIKPTQYCT